MRNPLRRRQQRADVGDRLIRAWQLALAERDVGDARATAIAEVAAREYAAAFADVQASYDALTPELLSNAGRRLVSHGEFVACIEIVGGVVQLREALTWDVSGAGADPNGWFYRLTLPTPNGDTSRHEMGAAVLHWTFATHARAPWRGISPLDLARATAQAVGGGEGRLAEELSSPVGFVVPVPQTPQPDENDPDADPLQALAADLAKLEGKTTLVETTSAGWGDGKAAAPAGEWSPRRIGASPPGTIRELRLDLSRALLAATGIPPDLVHGQTVNGAALQHLRRDFIDHAIEPLLQRLTVETARKLGPGSLTTALPRGDLLMRARSVDALVKAGVALPEARRIAGFDAA